MNFGLKITYTIPQIKKKITTIRNNLRNTFIICLYLDICLLHRHIYYIATRRDTHSHLNTRWENNIAENCSKQNTIDSSRHTRDLRVLFTHFLDELSVKINMPMILMGDVSLLAQIMLFSTVSKQFDYMNNSIMSSCCVLNSAQCKSKTI